MKKKARSAKTGKYVPKDYAKKNPETTVMERSGMSAKKKKELITIFHEVEEVMMRLSQAIRP